MSQASTSYLPITNNNNKNHNDGNVNNTNPYTAKAQALDCLKSSLAFLILIILLGLVPAITRVLILLQPQPPNFNVSSSSLSVLNSSSSGISADWNVNVFTNNPNKKKFSYYDIKASALSDRVALSVMDIAAFEVGGKNNGSIRPDFRGVLVQFQGNMSWSFNLSLELELKAKYDGLTWPVKRDFMKVVCEGFMVVLNNETRHVDFGSRECVVNGRWERLVTRCSNIFWNYVFVVGVCGGILAVSL